MLTLWRLTPITLHTISCYFQYSYMTSMLLLLSFCTYDLWLIYYWYVRTNDLLFHICHYLICSNHGNILKNVSEQITNKLYLFWFAHPYYKFCKKKSLVNLILFNIFIYLHIKFFNKMNLIKKVISQMLAKRTTNLSHWITEHKSGQRHILKEQEIISRNSLLQW